MTFKTAFSVGLTLILVCAAIMSAVPLSAVGTIAVDTVPVAQLDSTLQSLSNAGADILAVIPFEGKQPNLYHCDLLSEPCYLRQEVTRVKIVSRF